MKINLLKPIWQSGKVVVNGWLSIPSGFSAEVMAHQGYDSLTVDIQHGMQDFQTALQCFQAISTTSVVPLVRIPWLEPAITMKCLDAGAYGVVCPLINTRQDAERFVSYCRYPPVGERSYGPNRVMLYAGADYADHADGEILTIGMVETSEALKNLDAILSTPGLDAVYVGPADLALAFGLKPSFEPTDPRLIEAFEMVAAAAQRHGKIAGIHTGSGGYAVKMAQMGYRFITVSNDARLLASAASAGVKALRDGLA
jgi:4-hydroxy-2-oxoheptanedioate aldolase